MTLEELKAQYTTAYGYCHCGCGQLTPLAKKTYAQRGWIKGQPIRYIVGHSGGPLSRPIQERFWEYVAKGAVDECWLWQGYRNKRGYGVLTVGGHNGYVMRAYRLAWELHFGSIPDGLAVLHKCDNPPCCNPSHLFLGTIADNIADMVKKGRQAVGEANGKSKLTSDLVLEIRKLYAEGTTQSEIARTFRFSRTAIRNVVNRKTWRHLP